MEVDVCWLLKNDPNFICNKRYKNSLAVVEARYPDGAPDHVVAACLQLTEDEMKMLYEQIISCLREGMGVKLYS